MDFDTGIACTLDTTARSSESVWMYGGQTSAQGLDAKISAYGTLATSRPHEF